MLFKLLRFLYHLYMEGWLKSKQLLLFFLRDQRVRFALIGVAATLVYAFFGMLFVTFWKWHILTGNTLAYLLGFVVSYSGQALWTFKASGNHLVMLLKFAFTQLAGLGLNSCIVSLASLFGLAYLPSMGVAICLVPVFVFFVSKYWVFRKKEPEKEPGEEA